MDVKVVVWEDETGWGGGHEAVSKHDFTDVLQSEDIDGQDYYSDPAPDSEGGNNTLRASVNGVTAQIGKTRLVTFGFDKALIQTDHDCCGGNGETQFTLLAGRSGYQQTLYRGQRATTRTTRGPITRGSISGRTRTTRGRWSRRRSRGCDC